MTTSTCEACGQPLPGPVRVTESVVEAIDGQRSHQDTRAILEQAIQDRIREETGRRWAWASVRDWTDSQVVYQTDEHTYQCSYALTESGTVGTVELGEPVEVVAQTWYVPAAGDGVGDQGDGEPMDAIQAGEGIFDSSAHPRGSAGSSTGGQFVAAGSGGKGASKGAGHTGTVNAKVGNSGGSSSGGGGGGGKGSSKAGGKGDGSMSYDPKSKSGSGYSSKGGDPKVKQLQQALSRLGVAKLAEDGKFGPKTDAAVKAAQTKLGVPADGKVTPALLSRLTSAKSLDAAKATPAAKPAAKPTKAKAGGVDDVTGRATEAERVYGHVVEAKGVDESGGRIFRVRIIAYGDSLNRRRYPESVMREACSLYEGAKAYDHHRSVESIRSGSIAGLIGSYRNVVAEADGLYGDLHLLPSAAQAAEALDASLAAQEAGLPPLVGVSHDVYGMFRPGADGVQEATQITDVQSADVVANPAAGGRVERAVAGGTDVDEESDVPVTTADVLAALEAASPEQLAAHGLTRATGATESTAPTQAAEAAMPKGSWLVASMVKAKAAEAGLPEAVAESVAAQLPELVRESDVDAQIAGIKTALGAAERAGLVPTVATAQVTKESHEKKIAALDAALAGQPGGYTSFREAYCDITGEQPRAFGEDFNRKMLRESYGQGAFDSGVRSTESLTSTSWDTTLGDSITRRLIAEYSRPNLQTWRKIVSSTPPIADFRSQKIERIGGYGVLPTVAQGQPYQPLTSPADEEASYSITKRGGTEDLTLEMIANDDIRAIGNIPRKLGIAAAQTLYRFVWDILPTNAAVSYDSVALFDAAHGNTTNPALLSQSNLTALRALMRKQAAYGDTYDILSLVPKFLVVPSALEELAYQLCTSAVAIPATAAGPSNTPNIHQGLEPVVIDYYTDTNDWYLIADPSMIPTIEVGFYQGRQDPEVFVQADQSVGSMFNADKQTYKIRHVYSGTVLEHRAFQRGANA